MNTSQTLGSLDGYANEWILVTVVSTNSATDESLPWGAFSNWSQDWVGPRPRSDGYRIPKGIEVFGEQELRPHSFPPG